MGRAGARVSLAAFAFDTAGLRVGTYAGGGTGGGSSSSECDYHPRASNPKPGGGGPADDGVTVSNPEQRPCLEPGGERDRADLAVVINNRGDGVQ